MFKNVSSGGLFKKNVSQRVKPKQILDFALAEFSSAIEMLQAAKLVDDERLAIGFIEHALDEYRHTDFFLNILSNSTDTHLRFDPRFSLSLGFIRTDKFLFETCDISQFAAFISVNEANALKIFLQIRPSIQLIGQDYLNDLDTIIEDEREHMIASTQTEDIMLNFQHLLNDEQRHAHLSDKHLMKISKPSYRIYLKNKYRFGTWFRHIWASQTKIRWLIDLSISFLVINILIFFRPILKLPQSPKKNLISQKIGKYML